MPDNPDGHDLDGGNPESGSSGGRSRGKTSSPPPPKPVPSKSKRKTEAPKLTDDLTGKFLRVGNKLYRTSDDKKPIVRIEANRLVTSNLDALPDIVRIAKANGWTSIRLTGGDKFKQAAYLAAAAQGMGVENYRPTELLRAEADRLRARLAQREARRDGKPAVAVMPHNQDAPYQDAPHLTTRAGILTAMSQRFLNQSHAENARDPELRRAQKLVAQTMAISSAKHPHDPAKAAKEVEASRRDVAMLIAKGAKIAVLQVRTPSAQPVQSLAKEKAIERQGRSR
jgi:hypothetical protein